MHEDYDYGEDVFEYWDFMHNIIDQINEWRMDSKKIEDAANNFVSMRAYDGTHGEEKDWPYFCWDPKSELMERANEGYFTCHRRGMLRSGEDKINHVIGALGRNFEPPPTSLTELEFSIELSLSSAMYLADLEGCPAFYDTIADDGDMHYYIDEIAEYDDHWRFTVFEERFEYDDFEEMLIDILFDDGQDDDYRKATNLLSQRFNQIGVACNCHPIFS